MLATATGAIPKALVSPGIELTGMTCSLFTVLWMVIVETTKSCQMVARLMTMLARGRFQVTNAARVIMRHTVPGPRRWT